MDLTPEGIEKQAQELQWRLCVLAHGRPMTEAWKAALLAQPETRAEAELIGAALQAVRDATRAERAEEVQDLWDQLNNGMRENADGTFTVVWTQREVEQVRKRADELRRFFGWRDDKGTPMICKRCGHAQHDATYMEPGATGHGPLSCIKNLRAERDQRAEEMRQLRAALREAHGVGDLHDPTCNICTLLGAGSSA